MPLQIQKIYNCDYFLSAYLDPSVYLVTSVFLLLVLAALYIKKRGKSIFDRLGLIFVFIGGSLNIWERFVHGCVWDYLSFFGYFYFNVFDILVVLGLVLLTLGQIQPKILKEGGTYE